MQETKVTNRYVWEHRDDGAEEVTVTLHKEDRLRIITRNMELTILSDNEGPPEISILKGVPTIYLS